MTSGGGDWGTSGGDSGDGPEWGSDELPPVGPEPSPEGKSGAPWKGESADEWRPRTASELRKPRTSAERRRSATGTPVTARRPTTVPLVGPQGPRLAIIAAVVALIALSGFADRGRHPGSAGRATTASVAGSGAAGAVSSNGNNGSVSGNGGAGGTVGVGSSAMVTAMPLSAPAGALSSSWFCAGASVAPAGFANGRLVLVNAGNEVLTGKVQFLSGSGSASTRQVRVDPRNQAVIDEPLVPSGTYVGAIVDLDGGAAAVQQVVAGGEGTSSTACASAGSQSWYFPAGTTQVNSNLTLSLLNPYPADAIADLSFVTEQGQENPQDFQGLLIPAHGLVGVDIGSHLRDRQSVATTVHLRIGQLVAFQTQVVQAQSTAQKAANPAGAAPWPPGVNVMLGTPSPGTAWWWPSGIAGPGLMEKYLLYNPTGQTAEVSLGLALDQGSADPFQVSVSPFSVSEVTTNSESRIPSGIGHAAWLRSTNGVGVVAERMLFATSPSGSAGIVGILGSRQQSPQWVVLGDGTTTGQSENTALTVYNQGSDAVTISVTALGVPPDGFAGRPREVIQPGRRYLLTPSSVQALLITVSGHGQVVVEGDTSAMKGVGLSSAIGVPFS